MGKLAVESTKSGKAAASQAAGARPAAAAKAAAPRGARGKAKQTVILTDSDDDECDHAHMLASSEHMLWSQSYTHLASTSASSSNGIGQWPAHVTHALQG